MALCGWSKLGDSKAITNTRAFQANERRNKKRTLHRLPANEDEDEGDTKAESLRGPAPRHQLLKPGKQASALLWIRRRIKRPSEGQCLKWRLQQFVLPSSACAFPSFPFLVRTATGWRSTRTTTGVKWGMGKRWSNQNCNADYAFLWPRPSAHLHWPLIVCSPMAFSWDSCRKERPSEG